MILHNDVMANGLNPNATGMQVNSLANRRSILPPIATSYNGNRNSRFSHGNTDLKSSQACNLPRINFNSFGLENSGTLTDTNRNIPEDDSTFSFPRVYTVLPPIGEKFVPSAPPTVNVPNAPSNQRKHKRSTRRPRVKKQPQSTEVENVSKDIVSNSETIVDNASLIKTSVGDSEKIINSESFAIHIPDSVLPTIEVNLVETQNITEPQRSDTLKSDGKKQSDEKLGPLGPYSTLSEIVSSDDGYSDNECGSETPFPQFSTIPDDLRLYADVYPPSPPPNERRATIAVEKTRQLLVEENGYRISFMDDVGHRRRNATCVELDDALKNAIQLLRDLFLRKTMEELCMLW